MNAIVKLSCLGVALATGPSLADDAAHGPAPSSYKQKMDECLDRQRSANAAMSRHDMKKACKREVDATDYRPKIPPSPALVPAAP